MILVIAALVALVPCASSVQAPQRHSKSSALLSRGRHVDAGNSVSVNDTSLGKKFHRPPSCIQNTGVSCMAKGCDASHGDAECKLSQCFCKVGCSSSDGVCHKSENVLVATGVRLKNARWPAYYLVASTMDSKIHVATNGMDPMARFNLYQLPGQGLLPKGFLLVPQSSPGYAVSVVHKYHCDSLLKRDTEVDAEVKQNDSLTGGHCKHTWNARMQPMTPSYDSHPSVQDAAVHLAKAPTSSKTEVASGPMVTIRGAGEHVSKYMFVHEGSSLVLSRADNPGLGGYWIPEPPLAFGLSAFDGPPCERACDSSSLRSAIIGGGFLLALVVTVLS